MTRVNALPDDDELERWVRAVVSALDLLRPTQRWTVRGLEGPAVTPTLHPVLEAAPPPFSEADALALAQTFFDPGEASYVERQSRRSEERVASLGERTDRPVGALQLQLSEPLISVDRDKAFGWVSLLQFSDGPTPTLEVSRVAELPLKRCSVAGWTLVAHPSASQTLERLFRF